MKAAMQYSLASDKELNTAESSETGSAEARLSRDGFVGSRRLLHGNVKVTTADPGGRPSQNYDFMPGAEAASVQGPAIR